MGHVLPVLGLAVEEVAEFGIGGGFAGAEFAEEREDLLGVAEGKADVAVVLDVDQIAGVQGVDLVGRFGVFGGVLLAEAEDDAGHDGGEEVVQRGTTE